MTRGYTIDLDVPPVGERVIDEDGRFTYSWRILMEDVVNSLYDGGVDLVKDTADTVDGISTNYYTRAQSDATFATILTTYTQTQINSLLSGKADSSHTHAASDITSGTLADARIPSLAISKVTGLQTSLDGKVDESAFGTPAADMSLVSSHYIDITLPNGDTFRLHGELNP